MTDIDTCRYTKLIENYDSLDIEDSEVTKKRIEYLYKLYNLCSDEVRVEYIKRIENILDKEFNISICLLRNSEKTIEFGKKSLINSRNKKMLGKCLPIVLTLEKELLSILQQDVNNDNLKEWMLNYLKKYDNRLNLDKEVFNEYDVFNAYSQIGGRKAKFKFLLHAIKIKAVLSGAKEK